MIRATVMEVLDEDYVRTARAKGASEGHVLRSHVIRNALLPVVTMLGMDIGLAVGGAIFIENVYNLPGLGRKEPRNSCSRIPGRYVVRHSMRTAARRARSSTGTV
jgi:ABC-type microcin C transport system permease subunit YejB